MYILPDTHLTLSVDIIDFFNVVVGIGLAKRLEIFIFPSSEHALMKNSTVTETCSIAYWSSSLGRLLDVTMYSKNGSSVIMSIRKGSVEEGSTIGEEGLLNDAPDDRCAKLVFD